MRALHLVQLDKVRPAVVLTRALAVPHMRSVTVAPITTTVRGYASEVPVGRQNGLDHDCVINCAAVQTVPARDLLRQIGFLFPEQERLLTEALQVAFDLV